MWSIAGLGQTHTSRKGLSSRDVIVRSDMSMNEQVCANTHRVYMAAFDHRGSLQRVLDRIGADSGPAHRGEVKLTIWQGLRATLASVSEHAEVAVLVDRGNEQIAREAEAAGVAVAVALEESGRHTLRGDASPSVLHRDLRLLRGGFGKVLMRWHPDDPASRKRRQLAALRELDRITSDSGAELLLELLIHPGLQQEIGQPSAHSWQDSVLPGLQHAAVEEILGSGTSPALWKIEGHSNAEAAARLDTLVGSARADASILILGGGTDIAGLQQLFACRIGNERFRGFAVGRSIWQQPVSALCMDEVTHWEAQRAICDNFLAVIDAFESAARVPVETC